MHDRHDAQSETLSPASPTSNFNPRLPLVRYGFPPVFPAMSLQESRLLWCILEGDPKPYDVFDIPIGANVNKLKAAIKQKIEYLHDTNVYHLKLWKVVSLIPRAYAF